MARLIFEDESGATREVMVGPDTGGIYIGRHRDCAIRRSEDDISRRHARVEYHDGAYLLTDLGSTQGTFVRDEPVGQHWLRDGDELRCGGSVVVRFEFTDPQPVQKARRPAAGEQYFDIVRPEPRPEPPRAPAGGARTGPVLEQRGPPAAERSDSPWYAPPEKPAAPEPDPRKPWYERGPEPAATPAPRSAAPKAPAAAKPSEPQGRVGWPLEWEEVESDDEYPVARARVPGGWLVRTMFPGSLRGGLSLAFVPDPNHEW